MKQLFIQKIRDAGVVGAGGAGFPTYIKVNCNANVVIANGAECEPLLAVDKTIMTNSPDKILEGLKTVMQISGAKKAIIYLKKKNKKIAENLQQIINMSQEASFSENHNDREVSVQNDLNISIYLADDYYPAGDEQQIVYEVTKKVIPLGGIPLDVSAIVLNVTTLHNISNALAEKSVTNKMVTIVGEVNSPCTVDVPIGTSIKDLVHFAGGIKSTEENKEDFVAILGGPLMGKVTKDWETPVTKTLGGVIVLQEKHPLVIRKTNDFKLDIKRAKSVCCQCNYCSQLCPRNLLGQKLEPHKVMRTVGYNNEKLIEDGTKVFACCNCGICTYYACNMGLSPSRIVSTIKDGLLTKGVSPPKVDPIDVNDEREYRKIPISRMVKRIGLDNYNFDVPFINKDEAVKEVKILLKQNIGISATATVKVGDFVKKGEIIGRTPDEQMGVNVHASIDGYVVDVNDKTIKIYFSK